MTCLHKRRVKKNVVRHDYSAQNTHRLGRCIALYFRNKTWQNLTIVDSSAHEIVEKADEHNGNEHNEESFQLADAIAMQEQERKGV